MKFAYWNTNLGGVLFSAVPQQGRAGPRGPGGGGAAPQSRRSFDYTLVAARFHLDHRLQRRTCTTPWPRAPSSRPRQAVSTSSRRCIRGCGTPPTIAKFAAAISNASGGRFHVNIISAWFKDEVPAPRRARGSTMMSAIAARIEFVTVLRGLLTGERFSYSGDFYRVHDLTFRPAPPAPIEFFQGGNSLAARSLAARQTDWYFMNGDTVEGVAQQIAEVRKLAEPLGRKPKFAVNAFVVLRDSESEAADVLDRILAEANTDAVEAFRKHVQGAGSSTKERIGMWANSSFANLVQPNDGFKTGLIGTAAHIREQVRALEAAGVNLILCGFLDFLEEPALFGASVIRR